MEEHIDSKGLDAHYDDSIYEKVPLSELPGTVDNPKGNFKVGIPQVLPHEQVYSIQVGEKIFKLSGASLSSDAPSYFTNFFLKYQHLPEGERPTLYIDRSPRVFESIVTHLQGYYSIPKDDVDFVYLLLDANYYHLPKLVHQLSTAEIFVRIGTCSFRIPRNIFSNPGDTPNFFTLGFSAFFGSEIEPQVSKKFIRPPPLAPPTVPNRSGQLFGDLLTALQGAPLEIQSEEHRQMLLKECRYYRFRNLEQKLIAHSITKNRCRQTEEIILNLEDVKLEGLSLQPVRCGYNSAFYKRPFADSEARELIFQVKQNEMVALIKTPPAKWEASFYDDAREKLHKMMNSFVKRFGCTKDTGQHGYHVDVDDAAIILNGKPINPLVVCSNSRPEDYKGDDSDSGSSSNMKKRKLGPSTPLQMVCERSQWRLVMISDKQLLRLQLLRAECYCGQRYTNLTRQFL